MRRRAMILCPACGGHGLDHDGDGGVTECSTCGGACEVRARDAKGRWLPWVDSADLAPEADHA